MAIIKVSNGKAIIDGNIIAINLEGKQGWEVHSILLDYVEEKGINACIVPYDCAGGCLNISCPHNQGTMGG